MSDQHSAACREIHLNDESLGTERYRMGDLAEEERRIVLTCPHRSHDAARFIWRVR